MAEGRTAFLGDLTDANPFLEACGFPCPVNYNPADHWVQVMILMLGFVIEAISTVGFKKIATFENHYTFLCLWIKSGKCSF